MKADDQKLADEADGLESEKDDDDDADLEGGEEDT